MSTNSPGTSRPEEETIGVPRSDLQLPFGAVYFRKSNPPKEDWERDYAVAGEDGLNIFCHWFMWGAIETAPGVYDWSDYDRQLDLAAANGIKTIIAEIIHSVPEWAMRTYAHARQIRADGSKLGSPTWGSAAPPAASAITVAEPAR